MEMVTVKSDKNLIARSLLICASPLSVFPVGISGMITLPVTAQMYHSLVQQQIPNNDNTVCVTPMQVQNFISSNSLCGSIANSNLNASTTYIMTSNNRNVIGMPYQATNGSIKTIMTNPSSIYVPKNRTIVKKTLLKKRVLNLAMAKPKKMTSTLSQTDVKKNSINNNSTNAKNRNQEKSQPKVESLLTSQSKAENDEMKKVSGTTGDDPKVKEEDTIVDNNE